MVKKYLITSLILLFVFISNSQAISNDKLTPGLDIIVSELSNNADSLVEIVIFLENSNSSDIKSVSDFSGLKRSDRIKSVINRLSQRNSINREYIKNYLANISSTEITEHWIVPAMTAKIPISKLDELSKITGVRKIVENVQLTYNPPVKSSLAPDKVTAVVANELNLLNVPLLWQRGLKGKGRLICSFDTGVDQSHPALASKWRGNKASLPASWFSKVKPDSPPYDATGHGTHTMGIMVGSTEADSFGVAPDAEWITAGIIDQGRSLSVTISDILDAFQWVLNPDGDVNTTDDVPDVILNSWGIPKGLFAPCDDTFWEVIDNVEAAGIVTIFAAGNEGPNPKTLRNPADRATTSTNSFSVGAVNNNLVVADFSSRGPSSCDTSQIKPEVVAPGVNIRSSKKGGGFAYMSGTSMAAPYIAASVALVRQYNPEATVEQIKNAFIKATVDLGPIGEDNAYGNGFVDLAKVLDYIPSPQQPEVIVVNTETVDGTKPLPGGTVGLMITLNNVHANLESVTGVIKVNDPNGTILVNNTSVFYFGNGGTYAINHTPFDIALDKSLYHGEVVSFNLELNSFDNSYIDILTFDLIIGIIPPGQIAEINNSKINLSVSDFGQYGFAQNSMYNLLKDGFQIDGSKNLLYEAGLIIGRNSLQLSSSIRDEQGKFKESDFSVIEALTDLQYGNDNIIYRTAAFTDAGSEIPIPIQIYQNIYYYDEPGYSGMLFFDFSIRNNSLENVNNLVLGFFNDFDLSQNDSIFLDNTNGLIYQKSDDNQFVGLVALNNINVFQSLDNNFEKVGFSKQELYQLLTITESNVNNNLAGDKMFMVNSNSFNLSPNEIYKISFAYVVGSDMTELLENGVKARQKFDITTDVADDFIDNLIPVEYILNQNYPNPFNPETNISFTLSHGEYVRLEIFNVLGQKVKLLFDGYLQPGSHTCRWDGTNQNSQSVAGGVYFYRLTINDFTATRKMLLLK